MSLCHVESQADAAPASTLPPTHLWTQTHGWAVQGRWEEAQTGLTCWGMKELENVTADQKKMPQLRITFLLKRSPR